VVPVAVRNQEHLNNAPSCGKIDHRRQVEIFSQLVRHLTAIVYLVAELWIGKKPEKL
jgi:hypothetical protein